MKMSLALIEFDQCLGHEHHTSASPNTTFHNVACDIVRADVADGIEKSVHPFGRGHSERSDFAHELKSFSLTSGKNASIGV